jgi:hypothetical protein
MEDADQSALAAPPRLVWLLPPQQGQCGHSCHMRAIDSILRVLHCELLLYRNA